jgi:hypothetical protein
MTTSDLVSLNLDRRRRFREYMKAFNPTAPPRDVIAAGLVLENLQKNLHRSLAARADLEPGSQQLIVGGIGSGKTTELLLAEQSLTNQANVLPLFIDVSAETDLSGFNSGALLASFGLHLAREIVTNLELKFSAAEKKIFQTSYSKLKEFGFGKMQRIFIPDDEEPPDEEPPDFDDDETPGHYQDIQTPGKLKPPMPALQNDVQAAKQELKNLIEMVWHFGLEVVVFFDGLDRLVQPEKFWSVVEQDFRVLRSLRIGVLSTAPISVLYGVGKQVSDHFDRVHHIAPLVSSPKDDHLQSVIERRQGAQLLEPESTALICKASGGVLRDLITMARDAGEEAYIAGSDRIGKLHAEATVKQLGTSYLRGLGTYELHALRQLHKTKSFDLRSPINVQLLVTRRVLEDTSRAFRVHPALLPLVLAEAPRV